MGLETYRIIAMTRLSSEILNVSVDESADLYMCGRKHRHSRVAWQLLKYHQQPTPCHSLLLSINSQKAVHWLITIPYPSRRESSYHLVVQTVIVESAEVILTDATLRCRWADWFIMTLRATNGRNEVCPQQTLRRGSECSPNFSVLLHNALPV
jgi:hypothetical protein